MARLSTRLSRILLMLIVAGVTLTGCGQVKIPQDHYYRLNLNKPARMGQPALQGTLAVRRFAADGMLQGRAILYSQSEKPLEVESYHYHHWIDIPPLMLQELLIDYLREANIAPHVVSTDMDTKPNYIIEGRINRLERLVGSPPEGVIELEIALIRADSRKMILHRLYRQKIPTNGRKMVATVKALNQALSKIYADFLGDLLSLKTGS
jgi:ABC-type uncharacterized transport system auxiliary subunit